MALNFFFFFWFINNDKIALKWIRRSLKNVLSEKWCSQTVWSSLVIQFHVTIFLAFKMVKKNQTNLKSIMSFLFSGRKYTVLGLKREARQGVVCWNQKRVELALVAVSHKPLNSHRSESCWPSGQDWRRADRWYSGRSVWPLTRPCLSFSHSVDPVFLCWNKVPAGCDHSLARLYCSHHLSWPGGWRCVYGPRTWRCRRRSARNCSPTTYRNF